MIEFCTRTPERSGCSKGGLQLPSGKRKNSRLFEMGGEHEALLPWCSILRQRPSYPNNRRWRRNMSSRKVMMTMMKSRHPLESRIGLSN